MTQKLTVVADNDALRTKAFTPEQIEAADRGSTPETVAAKIQRLQAEARQLARDHVKELSRAICIAERMAADIADGGDAYPPGVRDLCRRFVEDCEARVQTLEAISART